jgi:hypothetical protein
MQDLRGRSFLKGFAALARRHERDGGNQRDRSIAGRAMSNAIVAIDDAKAWQVASLVTGRSSKDHRPHQLRKHHQCKRKPARRTAPVREHFLIRQPSMEIVDGRRRETYRTPR